MNHVHYGTTHTYTARSNGVVTLKPGQNETLHIEAVIDSVPGEASDLSFSGDIDSLDLTGTETLFIPGVSTAAKQGHTVSIAASDGSTYIGISAPSDVLNAAGSDNAGSVAIYKTPSLVPTSASVWTLEQLITPLSSVTGCGPYGDVHIVDDTALICSTSFLNEANSSLIYKRTGTSWAVEKSGIGAINSFNDLTQDLYVGCFQTQSSIIYGVRTGTSWSVTTTAIGYQPMGLCCWGTGSSTGRIGVIQATTYGTINIYNSSATLLHSLVGISTRPIGTDVASDGNYIATCSGTHISIYSCATLLLVATFSTLGATYTKIDISNGFIVASTSTTQYCMKLLNDVWFFDDSTTAISSITDLAVLGYSDNAGLFIMGKESVSANAGLTYLRNIAYTTISDVLQSQISVDANGIDLFSIFPVQVTGTIAGSSKTVAGLTASSMGADTMIADYGYIDNVTSDTISNSGNIVCTGNQTVGGTLGVTGALTAASVASSGAVSGTVATVTNALGGNGSITTPTYGFTNDTNSGLYSVGADSVGVTVGGALRLTLGTTSHVSTVPIRTTCPGFYAYLNNAVGGISGTGTVHSCVFDTEVYDKTSNYDTGTGLFTAPFDGNYVFNTSLILSSLTSVYTLYQCNFVFSGSPSSIGFYNGDLFDNIGSDGYGVIPGSCVKYMVAGETAKVTIAISGNVVDGAGLINGIQNCFFSGAFIS